MSATISRPFVSGVLGAFVVTLAVAPLRLAAGDADFPSAWRTTPIVIDGVEDEWAGHLVPIPETPVSIGILNDASFLYLCLRTSDEAMKKRIRSMGVNFYLDGTGKSEKSFGMRYPASPERSAPGPGDAPPQDTGGTVRLRRPASLDELEILGPTEADTARMKLGQARPVEAALAERDGTLVLEMKIPLTFTVDTPIAVQSAPGKTISVGIEGAQPARGDHAGGSRHGHGGGGHGGHDGAGPARSAGDRPADGNAASLKKWLRVALASPPPEPTSATAAPRG